MFRKLFRKFLLKTRNLVVKIIPENNRFYRFLVLIGIRLNAKSQQKRLTTLKMTINATHHCNLNCKCCTAFSPIADEYFIDVETLQRDLNKLAQLSNSLSLRGTKLPSSFNKMSDFIITGGEPLLHPRLTEIFRITREIFPDTRIVVLTNGVLLAQKPESFWESCNQYRVSISISKYPISININDIVYKAKKHFVEYSFVGGLDVPVKSLWKYPIDLEGKQTLKNSFKLCSQVNTCFSLDDGKIYPCNPIAMAKYFNKAFNQNLEISDSDILDLENVSTLDEIFDFLCSPKPFCRYCNRQDIVLGIKHGKSNKSIDEWT